MQQVDFAIDEVADFVDSKLNEAKKCVADGRKRVDDFVSGLKKISNTLAKRPARP